MRTMTAPAPPGSMTRTQPTAPLPATREHAPPSAPAAGEKQAADVQLSAANERIRLYAWSAGTGQAGAGAAQLKLLRTDEATGATGDPIADRALKTLKSVDSYLLTRFKRDGYDGKGSALEVAVHGPEAANAYWLTKEKRIELGDGDGRLFSELGRSQSVVAHEVYHGVISSHIELDYDNVQEAALNESLADLFAAGLTGSWRIGADVFTPGVDGDAIRDLTKPDVSHMKDVPEDGMEPHHLSGIPSLAAVRAAKTIGNDAMQDVWYTALTKHLHDHAGFADAAKATTAAARDLFGAGSTQAKAVAEAWRSVGITAG